ncbi:MAG: hypothetical protein IRY87_22750, partial [Acetobacteraceae bacterium]|nr:hypothetical protein [Acetobacteraceae bacterium]
MNVIHHAPEGDPPVPPVRAVSMPVPVMRQAEQPQTQPPVAPPPAPEAPQRERGSWRPWLLGAAAVLVAGGVALYEWPREQAPARGQGEVQTEPLSQGEFRLSDAEMRA